MARIDPEKLRDPERIFVAGSLRAARRVEEWLTMAGVDYAVQVEPFGRTVLFRTIRNGAAFYVTSSQAKYCREQLAITGLKDGVVDDRALPTAVPSMIAIHAAPRALRAISKAGRQLARKRAECPRRQLAEFSHSTRFLGLISVGSKTGIYSGRTDVRSDVGDSLAANYDDLIRQHRAGRGAEHPPGANRRQRFLRRRAREAGNRQRETQAPLESVEPLEPLVRNRLFQY